MGVIFVLTIIWVYRGVSDSSIQIRSTGGNTHFRAFISAIAFLTWVAAIGESFTLIKGYHIEYVRAAVVLLTIGIPGLGWKLEKE